MLKLILTIGEEEWPRFRIRDTDVSQRKELILGNRPSDDPASPTCSLIITATHAQVSEGKSCFKDLPDFVASRQPSPHAKMKRRLNKADQRESKLTPSRLTSAKVNPSLPPIS